MGTTCDIKWRSAAERERIWVVNPLHPIKEEIGQFFVVEPEEMYGEFFEIPAPEQLVFISWFESGGRENVPMHADSGKFFISGRETRNTPPYKHFR
jgi:trehalose utilization protein